ncbi:MAG: hypothetical protein NTV34_14420 [Proteobacteria bacterium]|nr:hypothetical protein [Pseudomonadota bacterium]
MNAMFIVILALGIFACKERDAAELAHTPNQPVRSPDAWQWQNISAEEFLTVAAPGIGLENRDQFIWSPEDSLVKRAQFWVSLIDDLVRKEVAEGSRSSLNPLRSVPKPKVIIVKDGEANAFVSPVSVCIDIDVRLNPEIMDSADSAVDVISLTTDGFARPDDVKSPCVMRDTSALLIQNLVSWFNANNLNCKMRFDQAEGRKVLTVPKDCGLDPQLTGTTRAKRVIVSTTSNWIAVNSGLFVQFPKDEWMMVPTLAHELGHYYRSHMTVFDKDFGFYYKLNDKNDRQKPIAQPEFAERGRMITEAARYLEIPGLVPKQAYHLGVYSFVTKAVRSMCQRKSKDCKAECLEIDTKFKDGTYFEMFGDIPDEKINLEAKGQYLDFENKAALCAAKIPIVAGLEAHGLTNGEVLAALDGFVRIVKPLKGRKLFELLLDFNSQLVNLQKFAEGIIAQAEADRLVRYTIEMEADEFGLEQFSKLGFDANKWLESEFVFNRPADENSGVSKASSLDDCESAYRRGWKLKNLTPYIPDRGGFYEPHPEPCFRIYNLSREIPAHRFPTTDRDPPDTSALTPWAEIVKIARSEITSETPPSALAKVLANRPAELSLCTHQSKRRRHGK